MAVLSIADLDFEILKARLEAVFEVSEQEPIGDHRLLWGVFVESEGRGDTASWRPKFIAETLFETMPGEIAGWADLDGRQGSWSDDDEMALLSTFEHEPLLESSWSLRIGGSGRLVFRFSGVANFDHPGGYTGRLPVKIETELEYAPIPNATASESVCRRRLAAFGITDPFGFAIIDGISYLVPRNYPRQ